MVRFSLQFLYNCYNRNYTEPLTFHFHIIAQFRFPFGVQLCRSSTIFIPFRKPSLDQDWPWAFGKLANWPLKLAYAGKKRKEVMNCSCTTHIACLTSSACDTWDKWQFCKSEEHKKKELNGRTQTVLTSHEHNIYLHFVLKWHTVNQATNQN